MPNNITGVDPFLSYNEDDILRFVSPTTSTTSSEIPEGTYEWEIMEVPIIHGGRPAVRYETIPHSIQQIVEQPMTPNDATPSPTNVIKARRIGLRPSSRIVHASVDIPKKKRDEFSEIERICKYPYKDKQIEF